MKKCLLSVDWDYFIFTRDNWGSYIENKKCLIDLWYKKYIQAKARGEEIMEAYRLTSELDGFWRRIRKQFGIAGDTKVYVSESHALSYKIAKENNCSSVYLFDSHADLGYGGLSSLNFEINCSNWLGKLLKDRIINEARIFYSPHTSERPEHFRQMNSLYDIRYCSYKNLDNMKDSIVITAVHICRSGAWTPPWLDDRFVKFVDDLGVPYETVDCPERKWDPENISLSDEIYYLIS